MKYTKNTMGIAERKALEVAGMEIAVQATEAEKTAAKLDYIAMMSDIDLSDVIPEDEEVLGNE